MLFVMIVLAMIGAATWLEARKSTPNGVDQKPTAAAPLSVEGFFVGPDDRIGGTRIQELILPEPASDPGAPATDWSAYDRPAWLRAG